MPSPLAELSKRPRPAAVDDQRDDAHGNDSDSEHEHDNPKRTLVTTEESPLLSPSSSSASLNQHEEHGFLDAPPAGHGPDSPDNPQQSTKSVWYMILLTVSIGGLQIAWSVELSAGSPYLLSLGMSKSLLALVWIAGPLSGTLVQPYVGMLSDRCRLSWGKRKPFMLAGAAATIASLMSLAWVKEIVGGFLSIFGADPTSHAVKVCVLTAAVVWVYILDFAINTVQAAIRAFIVDCAPTHQQEVANAMAGRFVGIGNIIGYMAGYANLPGLVWYLGNTQFKDLCAIASIALGATVVLSCIMIKERDPRLDGPSSDEKKPGVVAFFRNILVSIKRLPPQTAKVCQVEFFSWIGFFPMLFYTSEYIAELYVEPFLEQNPNMTGDELDRLYEKATRVGTFALLVFAITSLATNMLLPFLIAPTYDQPAMGPDGAPTMLKDYNAPRSWLDYLIIPGFTLRRAWMYSQVLFTGAMLCTVFVRTVETASILIGLVGITWALMLWAPWAIMSAEISLRDQLRRIQSQQRAAPVSPPRAGRPAAPLDGYSSDEHSQSRSLEDGKAGNDHEDDQAGVILGIHNMSIAAPQIIATVVSSIIFRIYQKPRGVPGDHSIAIMLALGGITVFVSTFFIHRIRDVPVGDVVSVGSPDGDTLSLAEQGDGEGPEDDDVGGGDGSGGGGDNAGPSSRSGHRRHRRNKSYTELPRTSLDRATLVRNKSYGGNEYST